MGIEDILFVDIETTGLSARSSSLYLVGVVYYRDGKWQYTQWLADNYEEELNVITAFFEFMNGYRFLIHYNGNRFRGDFCRYRECSKNFSG